ncbi:MAG: ABC transporter ATP-binding protein/permease [Defluviitaleaceae bacterium]|nr:ABC transporter ATP-binding protein/permease [Defluviitaleaceae bacterium]
MKHLSRYFKNNAILMFTTLFFVCVSYLISIFIAMINRDLIDFVVSNNMVSFSNTLAIGFVGILFFLIVSYIDVYLTEKFLKKISKDIRNDIYDSIINRSKLKFREQDITTYMSNIRNDVERLVGAVSYIPRLVRNFAGAFVILVIMLYNNLFIAFVVFCVTGITIILPIVFTKFMKIKQERISLESENFSKTMKEIFLGFEVINSFGLSNKFKSKFTNENDKLLKEEASLGVLRESTSNIGNILGFVTKFIIIFVLGRLVYTGNTTIGTVVMFTSLSTLFGGYIRFFMHLLPAIRSVESVAQKIIDIIDYKEDLESGYKSPTFNEKIEIKNLSFSYKDTQVLKNINLTINKNEKIAITGPSGSGKSTLIGIISKDYFGYSGQVLYDGVPLADIDKIKLSKLISVIHQDSYIFNESIFYNITLGEEFSSEELNLALTKSGVNKFVEENKISGGINFICGDKGVNLSGGQKQRIAIARAIIRGTKIIILDESTSAIDVKTANEIEEELLNEKELTLITITHRIKDGLLHKYDRVIDIQNLEI